MLSRRTSLFGTLPRNSAFVIRTNGQVVAYLFGFV